METIRNLIPGSIALALFVALVAVLYGAAGNASAPAAHAPVAGPTVVVGDIP